MFQSTHPRGVRLVRITPINLDYMFQSTHPRGVRPVRCSHADDCGTVSIHAPAWGATRHPVKDPVGIRVSIHAPAWGATAGRHIGGVHEVKFQSTHPRGVRPLCFPVTGCTEDVSIHAPAWGATSVHACVRRRYRVSIHAPAWGATWRPVRQLPQPVSFNPRTRVGCDGGLEP